MNNNKKIKIRDLRKGDWYWISKRVIKEYPKRIGATPILVYNFLASLADMSQSCFPSQKYIAESLGYSRATVSRAIKSLEKNALIRIKRRDRYHCTYLLIEPRCKVSETQMSNRRNSDVAQVDTNNNKLTRNINNNDNRNFLNFSSFKGFKPNTRKELLALDLAEELNDYKSLPFYLYCAKKYPEPAIRRILGEVKETPLKKIKKSRAALFNYLLKK
ncbi:MAG: helix-turn-helix domain-containing protein, partial [Candidatus Aerophobetes bacterium]|nr:helix-turn-helix domain-containing protein [Candidatus Aerophobetes bacterium]